MNTVIVVVVVLVVLLGGRALKQRRYAQVRDEARQVLERGAVVVDARSAMEFSGGHHQGAVNLPVGDAAHAAAKLGSTQRPVVVYCASGARSGRLAITLRQQGFEKVLDLGTLHNMRGLPAGRPPRR